MSFEHALQQAIYAYLNGFAGLPSVYDEVPPNPTFPYIAIGDDTHVPFDTDDSLGSEAIVTIHTWSRYRGRKEAKTIQGIIYQRLTRAPIPVTGFALVTIEFDYSEVLVDPDGITRHGVQRFRVLLDQ